MLLMYIKYTGSTSVSCIPFNDIYHKLAKMTMFYFECLVYQYNLMFYDSVSSCEYS